MPRRLHRVRSYAQHVGPSASANPLVKNCVLQGANASGSRGMYVERNVTALGNHIHDFNGTNGRGIHFTLSDTTVTPLVNNPASPDTNHTIITNCKIGIFSDHFSRPKIRGTRIKSCGTAIRVGAMATADIGIIMPPGESNGTCDVTGGTYFVYVDMRLDTVPDVLAYNNWWGTSSSAAIAAKMIGEVFWDPFLTQDPFISLARRWGVEDATNGPSRTVRVVPNPMRSGARLIASLEAADASVRYRVFDVAGRLIRTSDAMPSDTVAAEWEWDGRDAAGRRVRIGNYFVQLSGRSGVLATGRAMVSE
ncbi:MAG: FlgD immunoglobulin-like domain containing protein [Candidatus Eisenbacteria bacterium]|nr:FlgD immunoglobulin-like domain containing protein [Candidatus Eisenbacteria bacterium]